MAAAPMVMMAMTAATTAMSVLGGIRQGQAANVAAKMRARRQERIAAQETAAGQHAVQEKRRQTQLLQSRALAAAGASGGGTLDSSVLAMVGGIAEQGEEDVQRERFASLEKASLARQGAAASRFEGRQALKAGRMGAVGSALKGMSSMASQGSSMGFGR